MLRQVYAMTCPDGMKLAAKVLPAEDARPEVAALRAAQGCRWTLPLTLYWVSFAPSHALHAPAAANILRHQLASQ